MMDKKPKILVFTGAGLSAPSGLQTFRDNNGMWNEFDPNKVANMRTFKENKALIFEFYNKLRTMLGDIQPNKGHYMLAELQQYYGADRVIICTQNVDDLLEKAGCRNVIHVHGRLTDMMCLASRHIWNVGYTDVQIGTACPVCQNTGIKPGVIFFNEMAPEYVKMASMFHKKMRSVHDVVLCIGTRFEVVSEHRILGDVKSFNILANMHRDEGIDYKLFSEIFIGDINETAANIKKLILSKIE